MSSSLITILIVDDCSEDREIYRRFLEQNAMQGYRILETDCGVDGWELIQKESPDCILLDYQLPDISGLEFVSSLNAESEMKFKPAIMLTGQGDEEVATRAMANGAQDYLNKGKLTAEGLHRAINNAIVKSRLLRTNEEQQRAIKRSQQELEQFAHTLCHDLQAPLRRIINFVELIQRDLQDKVGDRSKEYLDRTISNAVHMQKFIQDMLSFALVGGDKKPPEVVNLNEVIPEVLTDLEVAIETAGAKIDVGQLPIVRGYPTMFHQLFQNLIGNAIKFKRDPTPLVKVSASPEGEIWHFKVEDNGIGIDYDCLEEIFDVFHRLHSKSEYEGSGIGLALCKKIVERSGGRIWVESAKDYGSVFHFTLPNQERPESALDIEKTTEIVIQTQ